MAQGPIVAVEEPWRLVSWPGSVCGGCQSVISTRCVCEKGGRKSIGVLYIGFRENRSPHWMTRRRFESRRLGFGANSVIDMYWERGKDVPTSIG